MTNLTKKELIIYKKLEKPLMGFDDIQKILDTEVKKMGYENHRDFLIKTGWADRFSTHE